MYVPYCTSDAYSGRKGASSATGGYAFYGKVQFFHISSTVSQFHWDLAENASSPHLLELFLQAVVEGLVEDLLTKVTMIS